MTPEREKYIGGISLYEQMLRNDIAHARGLMKEYKRELNEEESNDFALDAMSREELLARINMCKRYIMLFRHQLPQRGRNLKRCPFCGGKASLRIAYKTSCVICSNAMSAQKNFLLSKKPSKRGTSESEALP